MQGRTPTTRWNSGGASPNAPPSLAARGFTRRREQRQETGRSGSASFPSSLSAGGGNHRHLQTKKEHKQSILYFCFWFADLLLGLLHHSGSDSFSVDLFWSFACPTFSVSGPRWCDRRAAGGGDLLATGWKFGVRWRPWLLAGRWCRRVRR